MACWDSLGWNENSLTSLAHTRDFDTVPSSCLEASQLTLFTHSTHTEAEKGLPKGSS